MAEHINLKQCMMGMMKNGKSEEMSKRICEAMMKKEKAMKKMK